MDCLRHLGQQAKPVYSQVRCLGREWRCLEEPTERPPHIRQDILDLLIVVHSESWSYPRDKKDLFCFVFFFFTKRHPPCKKEKEKEKTLCLAWVYSPIVCLFILSPGRKGSQSSGSWRCYCHPGNTQGRPRGLQQRTFSPQWHHSVPSPQREALASEHSQVVAGLGAGFKCPASCAACCQTCQESAGALAQAGPSSR